MDTQLRSECQGLLEQLKASQRLLTEQVSSQMGRVTLASSQRSGVSTTFDDRDPIISYNLSKNASKKSSKWKFGKDITADVNVAQEADTDLKPSLARDKLCSLAKSRNRHDSLASGLSTQDSFKPGKENCNVADRTLGYDSRPLLLSSSTSLLEGRTALSDFSKNEMASVEDNNAVTSSSWQPATPITQRRRQLIDRHTAVPTKLNAKELRDLEKERYLNFSYSHIEVDDHVTRLKSTGDLSEPEETETGDKKTQSSFSTEHSPAASHLTSLPDRGPTKPEKQESFNSQLLDDGNNRKLSKFVKEAAVKPKSILNSSAYYSLNSSKRNNSRVRFNSSQSSDSQTPLPDHRLLGYDWIAALLDNDSALINQSESFFDELRDFRRANKDECSNQFYMKGPHTLVDTEPSEVVEALTEPKVRPYIVNDRLFTEPFRPNLIPYEDEDIPQRQKSKEPSKDNPRFVRVSIPRSTLSTPYRVKPHRRRSFDAADSCALMDHCLLGWENTRPEMLPAAKSLDLNTEAGTRQDSVVTSLAEAERLATGPRHAGWPLVRSHGRLQTLPTWRKHYLDTTLNMTQPPAAANSSRASSHSAGVTGAKRVTDRLLQSTYSNMYEMERLKQERELERKREEEERGKGKN
ncbi:uncharacterized protein LOC101848189 [Aplysia californica]|uniref:Uncharacterized protein LOC101848189 n=1 Tax=Aplysia californica TaxID=6500 RepID=A0ABM0JJ69_APLCA|nr:uncharacterized protein LOC101848189 [Aplysia californica]